MGPGMFDGIGEAILVLAVIAAVAVPLAIWKIADLTFFLLQHLHWS